MQASSILLFVVAAAALLVSVDAKLKPGDCEVCIAVVDKIIKQVPKDKMSNEEAIQDAIWKFCKTAKDKDERFCWWIGARKDSATGMLKAVSGPISRSLPADVVCERIKKQDYQVCELKYDKEINLDEIDFSKEKVKTLKKILMEKFDDPCKGCVEKEDYVRRLNQLTKKEL